MTKRLRGADAAYKSRETIMNMKQMKRAVSTFRAADVSIIKDEALRAKAQTLQAKQQGFTLLELLVVITLLATLAVGAMVAYEGIGENAKDVASANNINAAESAIRTYRAIEGVYPEQWDSLANVDGGTATTGGMLQLLDDSTEAFFGQWVIPLASHTTTPAGTVYEAVAQSLNAVGIEELQAINSNTAFGTGYVPNLALNESYPLTTANQGSEIELDPAGAEYADAAIGGGLALSIVPSSVGGTSGDCDADGVSLTDNFAGDPADENTRLNLINDSMDDDACVLVLALGFGKDMPGSTAGSRVAISTAPTATSANINPATDYARYIALFQVAADGSDGSVADGTIQPAEVFTKARLVGVVDTEGRLVDQAIAGANSEG